MSWQEIGFRSYCLANFLLALLAVGAWAIRPGVRRRRVASKEAVRALRVACGVAIVLPWTLAVLPVTASSTRTQQAFQEIGRSRAAPIPSLLEQPLVLRSPRLDAAEVAWAVIAVALVLLALQLRGYLKLRAAVLALPCIRRIGRVELRLAEENSPAGSVLLPGRAVVLLPTTALLIAEDRRLTVQHELQHHRQRDSAWHLALQALRVVCFWNPGVASLSRTLTEWQEFACDDVLMLKPRASRDAYAACLLRAADRGVTSFHASAVFMTSARTSHLRRRIERMYTHSKEYRWWWMPSLALAIASGGGVACVSAGWATTAHVNTEQARTWAQRAQLDGPIPLQVNESVVHELDQLVKTQGGHAWVTAAMRRMPEHLPTIERKLAEYGLPHQLAAIPLLESGYRNDVVPREVNAAGLWQFIPATARTYGLRVEPGVDERTDVSKETDAAMRYLRDLYAEFHDWSLALKAYNEGAEQVEGLIQKYGTRDAWELERRQTQERYLSRAVAAIIVFETPEAR